MSSTASNIKLSVSIRPVWADFVDRYRSSHDIKTKSEVIERALELLHESELELSYELAMKEYIDSGDREQFEGVVGDGLNEPW